MSKELVEKYVTLQKLDSRIFAINKKLEIIPELLKESQTKASDAEHAVTEIKIKIDADKEKINKLSAAITNQTALNENSHKKLSLVKNSKEYQAALKELDLLKKKLSDDSETLKKLSTEHDSDIKKLEAAEKVYNDLNAILLKEKTEKNTENKDLYNELEKLIDERNSFATTLKGSELSKYNRISDARNNLAIVELTDDGTCTGCFMKLTPQMTVNIKRKADLHQCPHCQRFIYHNPQKDEKEV